MCLAIPGKILSIEGTDLARAAQVDFGGVLREASLVYVPEAEVGDYVIVHAGFAISLLDEVEAQQNIQHLQRLGAEDA